MKHTNNAVLAGIVAMALVACSSGDQPSNGNNDRAFSGASAEGAYGGQLTGSLFFSNFVMVVLDDATFWLAYGRPLVGPFGESGFVQGSGTTTSSTRTFTSTDARDFGDARAFGVGRTAPVTVTATYSTAPAITGSIVYDTGALLFDGASPIPGTNYSYNTPASMQAVLGAWTLVANDTVTTALTIAASGTITGTDLTGCSFTGSIAPRSSGRNVFNVTLTFGPAPCTVPLTTMTGIALAMPLTTGRTELLMMANDATRAFGYGASGTR